MFNIKNDNSIEQNYSQGLLPQRNQKNLWYSDSSCRSDLSQFSLSSENRRILKKTENFSFTTQTLPLKPDRNVFTWAKELNWDFPANSIKTVFSNHIFNKLYTWTDNQTQQICAYSVCCFSPQISHIAYVFYHPQYSHQDLPIRLVLQIITDSKDQNLQYSYLGRFDPTKGIGYYKRTLPGFEYYKDQNWVKYK